MDFKSNEEKDIEYQKAVLKAKRDREERIKKGYIKIISGSGPEGGQYTEAHFFDEEGNYTTSEKSSVSRTLIFDKHGNCIKRIYGVTAQNVEKRNHPMFF